jgi:hypothetical protein
VPFVCAAFKIYTDKRFHKMRTHKIIRSIVEAVTLGALVYNYYFYAMNSESLKA